MTNKPVWVAVAAVVVAFAVQGCAQTGEVRNDAPPAASPAPAAAPAAAPASAPVAATTAAPSGTAIPENDDGKPVMVADTKDHFDAVAAAVRQQMEDGGRFAFVDGNGRATVNGRLQDMAGLFNQYGSVDKMPPAAQSRLLGDQNAINEVLARYDSNRLICRNEMPVGSHLPKRVCKTLGQIHNEQLNSQKQMRDMQMRPSQVGGKH